MHTVTYIKSTEFYVEKPGKVELVYTSENGEEKRSLVQEFKSPGSCPGNAQYGSVHRKLCKKLL